MSLLELQGITASYGPVQALFGVDLTLAKGEAVALMGRNGMGKTTTVRCLLRMMASEGQMRFDGHDLSKLPSHRVAQLGIGLVPEGRRCFGGLSVGENLTVAARRGPWGLRQVHDLFPVLEERATQKAGTLSGGEQQMLAIGRALMTNPRLLVLDEATEGLAPVIRGQIWAAVGRLKASGLALLLVDKSLKEMRAVMDRTVILERGRSVWTGTPDQITGDVAARYLGV